MRTRNKAALLFGSIFVTIIIVSGFTVYYFQNNYSYRDFYKRLETRARIAANCNLYPNKTDTEYLAKLRNQHLERLDNEKEYFIPITKGESMDDVSVRYSIPAEFLQELLDKGKANYRHGDIFFSGLKRVKEESVYLIVISAENYYATHHLMFLRNMLIIIVIFSIGIVLLASVYFSRHVFDPMKEINQRVKLISTENIHLRLENVSNNKEINELINTFNDLLNRIETAFETQKNFISNASHELGTPLTSIIGEADVTLLKERSAEEYKKSLKNILVQAERLDKITASLLFLAQTGYKGKAIGFERIRLDEVVWETKELIDKLNPNNKIVVDLSLLPDDPVKLKVKGNKQLLQLALANILNNACKYSKNDTVTVHLASSHSHVIVIIEDKGIGIPESELAYIFDPFFRASNTSLFEGFGIGLPLARNVVQLHKGYLDITSVVNSGTRVQIKIPIWTA